MSSGTALVADDLRLLEPTRVSSTPRFFEALHAEFEAEAARRLGGEGSAETRAAQRSSLIGLVDPANNDRFPPGGLTMDIISIV